MKKLIDSFEPEQILYLKGDINYSEIYMNNGVKIISCSTLLKHQNNWTHFIRVSRSYLINPLYISEIEGIKGDQVVVLLNGQRMKVARRRVVPNIF